MDAKLERCFCRVVHSPKNIISVSKVFPFPWQVPLFLELENYLLNCFFMGCLLLSLVFSLDFSLPTSRSMFLARCCLFQRCIQL